VSPTGYATSAQTLVAFNTAWDVWSDATAGVFWLAEANGTTDTVTLYRYTMSGTSVTQTHSTS
jgi:hypothetical protein